jgi:hypothetical protein
MFMIRSSNSKPEDTSIEDTSSTVETVKLTEKSVIYDRKFLNAIRVPISDLQIVCDGGAAVFGVPNEDCLVPGSVHDHQLKLIFGNGSSLLTKRRGLLVLRPKDSHFKELRCYHAQVIPGCPCIICPEQIFHRLGYNILKNNFTELKIYSEIDGKRTSIINGKLGIDDQYHFLATVSTVTNLHPSMDVKSGSPPQKSIKFLTQDELLHEHNAAAHESFVCF